MRVIAIDMDGTATMEPARVNVLHDNPINFIVIYTARSESIREETERELRGLGIQYHALVMNKLVADVYVDDRNAGGLQWPD